MITLTKPFKIVDYQPGTRIQLKNTSNSNLLVFSFIFLIILVFGLIFYKWVIQQDSEWIMDLIFTTVLFLLLNGAILARDYKQVLMPLSELSFGKGGIHLKRSGIKKEKTLIAIDKIKRMRVFVDQIYDPNTTIDFHLNFDRFPVIQMKLSPFRDKNIQELIEDLMHSVLLVKFQKFKLSNGVLLFEYVTDTEFRKTEKFSRNNFHLYETKEELNYQARIDTSNFLKLDLKNNVLTAKTNMFYTVKLPFENISNFIPKVSHQGSRKHMDEFIISEIMVIDHKRKEHKVLSNKLSLVESNYNILHFEALKEMNEIIRRISEITNVAGNIKQR